MSKLAQLPAKVAKPAVAKIKTRSYTKSDARTFNDGAGYARKPKGELFLLAVSNFVGEETYYESGKKRDTRFAELVAKVTKSDPNWIARFVPYLRNELNMRSASIVMAVEYVVAGGPNGRKVIDSAIVRSDEPAEAIGYYRAVHGRNIPQPIKRGVADAATRLYSERNALKYDSKESAYRFGDVIDIVHPIPKADWQSLLFRHLIDRRHNRPMPATGAFEGNLPMIFAYQTLMDIPVSERRALLKSPERLAEAGMTWESVSGWLQGPMDAEAWEAIIPSMGYMALLRNLRNFEQAKVSASVMNTVLAKLADPEEVAKSRQLPLRFHSAFKNVENLKAKAALEEAIAGTLQNVPSLKGRTLILVDNSGSMSTTQSGKSALTFAETAGLFGAAVALRAEKADLYRYGTSHEKVNFTPATPVLELARKFKADLGGTNTFQTLDQTYSNHDRVIILTDEQANPYGGWGFARKPASTITKPVFTFNLAGYKVAQLPSGAEGRYTFGGLTDAGFRLIDLIERGQNEDWPF